MKISLIRFVKLGIIACYAFIIYVLFLKLDNSIGNTEVRKTVKYQQSNDIIYSNATHMSYDFTDFSGSVEKLQVLKQQVRQITKKQSKKTIEKFQKDEKNNENRKLPKPKRKHFENGRIERLKSDDPDMQFYDIPDEIMEEEQEKLVQNFTLREEDFRVVVNNGTTDSSTTTSNSSTIDSYITDTSTVYSSEVGLPPFEKREYNNATLEIFKKYEKYIYSRNVMQLRPDMIMKVPQLEFLPNLRNPCFLVENEYDHIMDGIRPTQVDRDIVPGLSLKCLPYMFLCATEKSGTSDLFTRLRHHQFINFAMWKENYFFNGQSIRFDRAGLPFNFGGYFSAFKDGHKQIEQCLTGNDMSSLLQSSCPHVICDATPRYLHSNFINLNELAPHRIKHLLGNRPKLLMMFRNPTDRLLSDYRYFERQKGRAKKTSPEEFHNRAVQSILTFQKCLDLLPERNCVYKDNITADIGFNESMNIQAMSRMAIGMYAVYVETWLSIFPIENFLFIKFEDYQQDPLKYIRQKVLPFLGLEDYDDENLAWMTKQNEEVINKNPEQVQPKEMFDKTRRILDKIYKPYNERFAKLLKDDNFNWSKERSNI